MERSPMSDGYISPEDKLPISSGEYGIKGIIGEGVAYFDAERDAFLPSPGVIGVVGWRYILPDAADIAEFRARARWCWPCVGGKDDTYGYENSD